MAGKTSLLQNVAHIVSNEQKDIFVLWFDLQVHAESELKDFLRLLALELAMSIWKEKFGKSFSELAESAKRPPSVRQRLDKQLRQIVDFYRLLKSTQTNYSFSRSSKLGGSLTLTAEASENITTENELASLEPIELMAALGELADTVLKDYKRILVLTDEATILPRAIQLDTLNRYLELLRDHRLQFFFAGVPYFEKSFLSLDVVCHRNIRIGRFDSPNPVKELIRLSLEDYTQETGNQFSFEKPCAEKIFELTEGVPYRIQELCQRSVDSVFYKNQYNVSLNDVLDVASKLLVEWQDQSHFTGKY